MSLLPAAAEFKIPTQAAITGARTVIVVPCYNEAARLDRASFLSALGTMPDVDFLFVDDGSRDATLDMLTALAASAPKRMTVLALEKNGGKAEAVRQGLRAAIATGADSIGYWDADLATPLDAIADMQSVLNRLSGIEVVFGSRRAMLGHAINRDSSRIVVSKICNMMARVALKMPIGDTQCGAKLFANTDALARAVATPFRAGWLFDIELFSRIANAGQAKRSCFYEMPLVQWTEIAGSSVSPRAVLRSGLQMLGLIAQNRFGLGGQATAFL